MTPPATEIGITAAFIQQAPAVAATLVIVWAFLRHMSEESKRHIDARGKADTLFTTALTEIRQDVRGASLVARESDIAVANVVGELTARVVEMQRINDRMASAVAKVTDAAHDIEERNQ